MKGEGQDLEVCSEKVWCYEMGVTHRQPKKNGKSRVEFTMDEVFQKGPMGSVCERGS